MTDLVLDLSKNPKQWDFYKSVVHDRIPNTAYIGGLGSGKTVSGTAVALTLMKEYPGIRILLTAPSFDQLNQGTLQTFQEWAYPYIRFHHHTEHRLEMVWNNGYFPSELLYRSTSEPDRIRSHEYAVAWMDEGARSSQNSLAVIRGRLRHRRGVPKGWHYPVFMTSTPVGRNWVWRTFGPGNIDLPAKERKRYRLIHARTADNPFLPDGYIAEQEILYRGDEQLRLQELEGMFVAFSGLVFPQFDERVHVTPDPVPWDSPLVVRRAAGVDFGGGHPTAIVVMGEGQSGRIHQYKERVWLRPVGLEEIGEYLMEVHSMTPLTGVFCDPTNQTAIATLAAAGLPAQPRAGTMSARAINDREEGIRLFGTLLSRNQHTINPDCTHSISEYYEYLYREAKDEAGGRVLTRTPSEHHADCKDAARYCFMGLRTSRGAPARNRPQRRRRMLSAA